MRGLVSKTLSKLKSAITDLLPPGNIGHFAIKFGISTFNKTRFNSHRLFISTCLKKKVIPKGFMLKFHHGATTQGLHSRCRSAVNRCSFQLMRTVLDEYKEKMDALSEDRDHLKLELSRICSSDQFREISRIVHALNQDLHSLLAEIKDKKLEKLCPPHKNNANDDNKNVVVKIPENLQLSPEEEKVLEKGLSFVPTSSRVDAYKCLNDVEEYYRKVRLKAYFAGNDNIDDSLQNNETEDELFTKKKFTKFTPKSGQFEAVDSYIRTCKKQIKKLKLTEKIVKKNISQEELEAIRKLKNRKDIVIKPADKGGAVCVWDKNLYIQEGQKQLSDERFYEKLDSDATPQIQKTLKKEVDKMISQGMSESTKNLLEKSPKASSFYLLPKIHKANIPGRPIVSNISCPTYQISKFLSGILQPIAQKCPSYIKDTTHLLQKIEEFTFENEHENNMLFTMDVKGLYTNIPNKDGLEAMKYYLEQEDSLPAPKTCILRLAELVLTLNCFEFNGEFYKQISGTMMGTPFAVNYSNLAMSFQEKKINNDYDGEKPILYLRYIDDIFGISTMPRENLERFVRFVNDYNPALKYTEEIGKEVTMLDTRLSITGTKIKSTLYNKPTDAHLYLKYSSSHPSTCKNSIPYSQFLRVRRICSEENDYEKESNQMATYFHKQGYPKQMVERQRLKVKSIKREELLKKKDSKEASDRLILPICYHPKNVEVVKILKRNFTILQNDDEVSDIFEQLPMVAYRRDRNLKDIMVRSNLGTEGTVGGTTKCARNVCITCDHINEDHIVVGPRGSFTIRDKFNCESTSLIYCIECKRCGMLYVGETSRKLKDRFREHRRNVLNKVQDNEVAQHFNAQGHDVHDMSIMGLKYVDGTFTRKLEEQRIIGKLGCVLGGGLNTDFNFPELTE